MKKRTINNTKNGLIILGVVVLSVCLFNNFVFAGQQQGGDIPKFDIQPRSISATNPRVTATIGIKIYPNEFISYCKNKPNVSYGLFLDVPGTGDRAAVSWTVVPTPNQVFEKEINVPLTSVNAGDWYVLLYCGTTLQTANDVWLSGGQMSKTSNITVEVYGASDFTFGCVAADGKYSCSPGAKPDCSDITASCGGRACSKIQPKSLCGKLATAIVMGCIASDGKYACSTGTAGNCSDIPACAGKSCIQVNPPSLCGTGGGPSATASRSYFFSITNPLKGGPNDLFDIINIVTKWIMLISIPLAVLYIMYAGFLMLTAGPTPANFQKGKDIIWYVVIGLAIIFIGKGFVTLIISVIELGGTPPPATQPLPPPPPPQPPPIPPGTIMYGCFQGYCIGNADPSVYEDFTELSTNPICPNTSCAGTGTNGSQPGSSCSNSALCLYGMTCKNSMCQLEAGNFVNEPCVKNNNCRNGATCDMTKKQIIDSQERGTCVAPAN